MAYVEFWFPQIPQVNMRLIAIKKNIYFDPNLLPDWNWKVGITRFEYVPKSLLCSGYSIFSLMCMLCRSLFVLLYFFWPFCCLFFDLWILDYPFGIFKFFFINTLFRYVHVYQLHICNQYIEPCVLLWRQFICTLYRSDKTIKFTIKIFILDAKRKKKKKPKPMLNSSYIIMNHFMTWKNFNCKMNDYPEVWNCSRSLANLN
jgi:hypothetical protein